MDRGSVESEESLGEGYMNGAGGLGPDYRAAVYWLERAASKGDGLAQINLGSLYADGKGVPRDMQRAGSLFVQATRSPDPRVANKARENLAVMSGRSPPARDRDDSTAAVVGVALVGLALHAIFSGSSDSSSGSGSGGGTPTTNTGGAPFGGSSPTPSNPSASPWRPVPRPMTGNIGKVLDGVDGMGSSGVVRK